jgi:hypothetical protein
MANLYRLTAAWCAAVCACSAAAKLPGDAAQLIPVLRSEIATHWPDVAPRTWIPAVIEQESLWRIRAQLKTDRELGCGLGQFTKAFNADGTVRFDALTETKRLDPSLAGWDWRDCANAQYQLRGVVLKLKVNERQCAPLMATNRDVKACNGGMYNGGGGSVTKRIRACQVQAGCNPRVWFGHLDQQCPQSKVKHAGYGESFCDINSKYPLRVEARQAKYEEVMK